MSPSSEDTAVDSERVWHFGRAAISASLLLAFGLWIFQLVFDYGLSSYAAYPLAFPRSTVAPGFGWVWPTIVAINLASLALALFASALAFRAWRRTNLYDPRSIDDVMEKAEGGPKYLEVWALVTGLTFAAVIVFQTFVLFLVPVCIGVA